MVITSAHIESVERATLQAVPPQMLRELPGWLLPMDCGTVGRARSAVPLGHGFVDLHTLDRIIELYRAEDHLPAFRLPDLPSFEAGFVYLTAQGFVRHQPTVTLCGAVHGMLDQPASGAIECSVADRPDASWMAMYLGDNLDPLDGACRAEILARAQGCRYASIRHSGQTVACGMASFGHGWLGVHGMRTATAWRGRGMASALLRAMAFEAQKRGIKRVFLQVDHTNVGAQRLYARCGLQHAWSYAYWRPAAV